MRAIMLAAAFVLAGSVQFPARAVDPELPDPGLTPGVIASTDEAEVCGTVNGVTYSKRHRQTTAAMKAQVAREYGREHCGEIDHRVELSLGGADDVKNLWCQPGPDEAIWNFKLKDRLEAEVWRRVCHQHSMTLAEGQAVFLAPDWRVEYCRIIGGGPCK